MRWVRLKAVARKEVIHIIRDVRSLGIVVIMPVVLVLFFGYGVSLDLKHLPIYVYDREASEQSQALLKRFQSSDYFEIVRVVNNYSELAKALDDGRAKMAFVIPSDFSEKLRAGGTVSVQALVDATDDNTANIIIGYTQALVQVYSNDVQLEWLQRRGQRVQPPPLSVETRTWYNENLESSAFIVPGVLAVVMSVIGAFLTSLTVAREWERGTMEQLISTPVTSLEIMLGKLVPYFLVGLFDAGVCVVLAIFWFQVPFRGTVMALLISSALFLIALLCLGFFISVVTKNQLAASQIALVATFLPAFLLSGFLFAIEQMPQFVQLVTRILPARYYVSSLKMIFLKGTPVAMLYPQLVPLAIFALVLATLATRIFQKRLV
ncbi:MAG: ABC transporter permease [Acidobacteriia bacterium]|jgi:ABC-2 type transport system permease protein|nr:ABC transporter permease [Terriglobia bacterium]